MKIDSQDFLVREGSKVDLGKLQTDIDPLCDSKAHYQERLGDDVERLSAMQELLYASNRHAVLLKRAMFGRAGIELLRARMLPIQ